MVNPNISLRQFSEEVIQGTVEGLIAEQFPGTEGRTRDEIVAVVRAVHEETIQKVESREMRAADAAAYEYKRYREELAR